MSQAHDSNFSAGEFDRALARARRRVKDEKNARIAPSRTSENATVETVGFRRFSEEDEEGLVDVVFSQIVGWISLFSNGCRTSFSGSYAPIVWNVVICIS